MKLASCAVFSACARYSRIHRDPDQEKAIIEDESMN